MTESKVVIVTGASKGLGAAVARWLGKTGTNVTIMARSESLLKDVAGDVKRLGGRALVVPADIADPEACVSAVEQTLEQYGRLDALVNNAGIVQPLALTVNADPAAWRYNLDVNLLGPFYMAKAALASLRKRRGRIVNVSSGAANIALEGAGAYCVAKAALTHFTRILAAEEPLVTSLSVRPGVVDTQMQETLRRKGPDVMPPKRATYYRNLKRHGDLEPPEIPGRAIAWLARHAPRAWSGRFLDYDDSAIVGPARTDFGEWVY